MMTKSDRPAHKKGNPKQGFLLTLVAIYLLSLPVLSGITYLMLRQFAFDAAYETGGLYLSTMGAVKHYVAEELRPALFREMPGRFLIEGMSRSYVSASVARRVNRDYKGYLYRNAQLQNPRNPKNLADGFEAGIINELAADTRDGLVQWRGVRETPEGMFFVVARRGDPYEQACMSCHGNPADAPAEMVRRYGKTGFGMPVGRILDAKFVYIPLTPQLASARKQVAAFIGIYSVFFAMVFVFINIRSTALYNRIEQYGRDTERINADLSELNRALEGMVAERTLSTMALTVADRVRNPASVMGASARRVLEHAGGPLNPRLRESLELIAAEAGHLERIVEDFETLVRTRKPLFVHEDINDLIIKLAPVLESEASKAGVKLQWNPGPGPLKANIEPNLFKSALYHIVKNAIEAAPANGGLVRITTKSSCELSGKLSGGRAVVMVEDNGPGIPPDDMDHIFDLFFTTKGERYGLGLPLVKQIVSEHMGTIEAVQAEAGGTAFRISIPLRWEEPRKHNHL